MARSIRSIAMLALAAPLLAAPLACSSGGGDGSAKGGTTVASESTPGTKGAGDARITIDGKTWNFAGVACGFGEEGTGVPGAIVNASASADGLSLYVADDGDDAAYVELGDVDDPDEGLNWTTRGAGPTPTITVEGKKVTTEATFGSLDAAGNMTTAEGTVEVNCG